MARLVKVRGRLAVTAVRLAAIVGLALLAVSGSVGLTPGTARTAPSSAPRPAPAAFGSPVSPPSGCGAATAAGTRTLAPVLAGHVREVRVHVPPGYSPEVPVPLLLNLHGTGSTAAKQEAQTGLDATADAHGFLVAYPQGFRTSGAGFGWNIPGTPTFSAAGPDDLGFLSGLITMLRREFCVDPTRVYASGFSGGARMVSQFACTPGVRLAGLIAAGGLRAPSPCHSTYPLAVLAFHGTADLSNPFNGHGQAYWTYSVPEAAARWARTDACQAKAHTSRPYPEVTLTDYLGCAGDAEVSLYALTGKGHRWPAASGAFQPDEILWRFLSGHATPGTGTPAPGVSHVA
jgi:polyhydroxybutyrate depolymerase